MWTGLGAVKFPKTDNNQITTKTTVQTQAPTSPFAWFLVPVIPGTNVPIQPVQLIPPPPGPFIFQT